MAEFAHVSDMLESMLRYASANPGCKFSLSDNPRALQLGFMCGEEFWSIRLRNLKASATPEEITLFSTIEGRERIAAMTAKGMTFRAPVV